jgi:hypothetical protein
MFSMTVRFGRLELSLARFLTNRHMTANVTALIQHTPLAKRLCRPSAAFQGEMG